MVVQCSLVAKLPTLYNNFLFEVKQKNLPKYDKNLYQKYGLWSL